MKKICIICILLLLFSIKTTALVNRDELEQIATLVMSSELEIDNWQVTIKEKMPIGKAKKIIKQLEKKYQVTVIDTKDFIKYTLQNNHTEVISETYEVIIEHENNVELAHFSAVLEGSQWDENTLKVYQNKIMSLNRHYFSEISRKYICLNTNNDAIIKGVDFISLINQELDVIHISTQSDTEQHSTYERIIYGYSPFWQQTIQVDNEAMNIQIVIKQTKDNQTKITIGTPILLNEY